MIRRGHDPGVVVEDVDPAICVDRVLDHGPRVVFLRNVGLNGARLPSGVRHGLDGAVARLLAHLGDDDLRSLLREHQGGDATHAASAASDDADLVGQTHVPSSADKGTRSKGGPRGDSRSGPISRRALPQRWRRLRREPPA